MSSSNHSPLKNAFQFACMDPLEFMFNSRLCNFQHYRWHCWPQNSLKKFVGDDLFLLLDVIQGRIQDFWKGGGGGGGGLITIFTGGACPVP